MQNGRAGLPIPSCREVDDSGKGGDGMENAILILTLVLLYSISETIRTVVESKSSKKKKHKKRRAGCNHKRTK